MMKMMMMMTMRKKSGYKKDKTYGKYRDVVKLVDNPLYTALWRRSDRNSAAIYNRDLHFVKAAV